MVVVQILDELYFENFKSFKEEEARAAEVAGKGAAAGEGAEGEGQGESVVWLGRAVPALCLLISSKDESRCGFPLFLLLAACVPVTRVLCAQWVGCGMRLACVGGLWGDATCTSALQLSPGTLSVALQRMCSQHVQLAHCSAALPFVRQVRLGVQAGSVAGVAAGLVPWPVAGASA